MGIRPEFSNQPVFTLGEATFVGTATVPATEYMPEGYLGFEIDAQGLPVPAHEGAAKIGVMNFLPGFSMQDVGRFGDAFDGLKDVTPEQVDANPRLIPRTLQHASEIPSLHNRPESGFQIGGAAMAIGTIYPECDYFESFHNFAIGRDLYFEEAAEPLRESLTIDDLATIAADLAHRDRDGLNNHDPRWLARAVSSELMWGMTRTKAIDLDSLCLDALTAVQDEEIWDRVKTVNYPTRDEFFYELGQGRKHKILRDTVGKLSVVVSSLIYPAAEQAVAARADAVQR